tara:strand:+ start:7749 stop:8846 length:1098 start_codon:yes stop_codon:yes gene_type:complete
MSGAQWRPSKGSWGWFGTAGSSEIGKLRRALHEEGGGAAPTVFGEHPTLDVAYADVQGLGGRKTRIQSVDTVSKFKKSWYNPVVKQATTDPLTAMSGIDTDDGRFTKYTGGDVGTGVAAADRLLPMLEGGESIDEKLAAVEDAKLKAEQAHFDEMATLDIAEKESKQAFTVGQREVGQQRKTVARGAEEEYAQAEATTGATGMAFSGAAQRGFDLEQSGEAMRQTGVSESELRRGYRSEQTKIEGKRTAADKALGEAVETYHGDIQAIYDAADTALDDITTDLTGIMDAHRGLGTTMGIPSLEGLSGMFREGKSSFTGYGATETNIGLAETFAQKMSEIAGADLAAVRAGDVDVTDYGNPYGDGE